MSIFRYIVQGVGWELGRTAAREGIEALNKDGNGDDDVETPAPVDAKEQRKRERAARLEAKRRAADLERQLAELKKKAGR